MIVGLLERQGHRRNFRITKRIMDEPAELKLITTQTNGKTWENHGKTRQKIPWDLPLVAPWQRGTFSSVSASAAAGSDGTRSAMGSRGSGSSSCSTSQFFIQ